MKKERKIAIIAIIAVIVIIGLVIAYDICNYKTIKAVVIRVYDNYLMVETAEEGLASVGFTKEGDIGFKKGQEIAIKEKRWGIRPAIFPTSLNAIKIKITKQESEMPISKEALLHCYSSEENVKMTIEELTNSGITYTIIDTNTIPYDYSIKYNIRKRVKNENYPEEGKYIGEATENSLPAYTRYGSRIFLERFK